MRSRQRRTMNLEVSAEQRDVLDRTLEALPKESGSEPVKGSAKLASLFYHPNASCRVMALVVSAGFDAVNDRIAHAGKKLDRAHQVFTLVGDDARGREMIEDLKGKLDSDVPLFLNTVHTDVAPYLVKGMSAISAPPEAPKKAISMPRAVEAGEELPQETRSTKSNREPRPRRDPEPQRRVEREAPTAGTVVEAVTAEPAAEEAAANVGPSEEEVAAAAQAALEAIEAPYDEVIEDDAPPRFDPDRDLEPDQNGGRGRRRRSKSPEGFERPRPDQVKNEPTREPAAEATGNDGGEQASEGDEAAGSASVSVSRGGDVAELAEVALEALKLALRRAREAGLEGSLRVEVQIGAGDAASDEARRKRRRRGRGRRGGGRREG